MTVTLHQFSLKDHIVNGITPADTRINLFDYWVDTNGNAGNDLLGTTDNHKNASGVSVERTGVEDWDKGINKGHLLLFGDGNIHAGCWNKGAGAGCDYGKTHTGMTGIVRDTLGSDGYPEINTAIMDDRLEDCDGISDYLLCGGHDDGQGIEHTSQDPKNLSNTVQNKWNGEASLDYLFTPNNGDFKRYYGNVQGLFQLDDYGYSYYDMRRNYAEFSGSEGDNDGKNRFILYDAPALDRNDGIYDPKGEGEWSTQRSTGNFFPFNPASEVFTSTENGQLVNTSAVQSHNGRNLSLRPMNHHLGMTVEVNFRQPAGGLINTGTSGNVPMSFQFSGDDDVWVFIDDVLVLDLGGIHSEIFGTIDFSTGEVLTGQSWKANGFPYNSNGLVDMDALTAIAKTGGESTTLRQLFEDAGKAGEHNWNGDTFSSDSNHTLKMFYLERGKL